MSLEPAQPRPLAVAGIVIGFFAAVGGGCSSSDTGGRWAGSAGQAGVGGGGQTGAGGAAGRGLGGAAGVSGGGGAAGSGEAPVFTRYPHDATRSPFSQAVAERVAAIAAAGPNRADDVFMKVGASGTVSQHLLFCFAGNAGSSYQVDLDGRDALLGALGYFRGGDAAGTTPFDRVTLAARVGMSASWAISGDPSPLEQEIAALNPRYAFVNYGTNDMQQGLTYASALWPFVSNLTALLDELEADGIVPLVFGLNPRSDSAAAAAWVPTYDAVTRALAEARQLPHFSLYLAMKDLADMGLVSDGVHGNAYYEGGLPQPCVMTPAGLAYNYNGRNLASLELLDVLWRVAGGEPAPDVAPPEVAGDGSRAAPFEVDQLPFSHTESSVGGAREVSSYACDPTKDESGPERWYRLELTQDTPLRVLVFDGPDVDVDLHVGGAASADACVARHDRLLELTLAAGTHYLGVDTFVSGGVEAAGEYTLVVVPCEPGDADCG